MRNKKLTRSISAAVGLVGLTGAALLTASPAMANGAPSVYLRLHKVGVNGQALPGAQYRVQVVSGKASICDPGSLQRAAKAEGSVAVPQPVLDQTYVHYEAVLSAIIDNDQTTSNLNAIVDAITAKDTAAVTTNADAIASFLADTTAAIKAVDTNPTLTQDSKATLADLAKASTNLATARAGALADAPSGVMSKATEDAINKVVTDTTAADNDSQDAQSAASTQDPHTVTNQAAIDKATAKVAAAVNQAWHGCTSTRILTTDSSGNVDIAANDGSNGGLLSGKWHSQADLRITYPESGHKVNGVYVVPGATLRIVEVKAPAGYALDSTPVTETVSLHAVTPVWTLSNSASYRASGPSTAGGVARHNTVTQADKPLLVHAPRVQAGQVAVAGHDDSTLIDAGAALALLGLAGLAGAGVARRRTV